MKLTNLLASRTPWKFPEILSKVIPSFLLHRAHSANLRLWEFKLPFVHGNTPADIAARLISDIARNLAEACDSYLESQPNGTSASSATALVKRRAQLRNLTITALNASYGTGIPIIEQSLNKTRTTPLHFKLTDPQPDAHLDSWIDLAAHSDYLHFLPQAIDLSSAAQPPPAVLSRTSPALSAERSERAADALMLYLWLGSLHSAHTRRRMLQHRSVKQLQAQSQSAHSNRNRQDQTTSEVTLLLTPPATPTSSSPPEAVTRQLPHALIHADSLLVLSLADRRLMSVLTVAICRFWLLWASTVVYYPWHRDWLALLFSFPVPVLPALGAWEALKECLESRTAEEWMMLVDEAFVGGVEHRGAGPLGRGGRWFEDERGLRAERMDWVFEGRRVRYRWPLGWVSAFVGYRKSITRRQYPQ